jgi:uncharacterized protein YjbI with pentapeptide repeats
LADTNLTRAYLRGANLTDTNLTRADLRGADLTDVFRLTQPQLDGACGGASTKLPDGLTIKACN